MARKDAERTAAVLREHGASRVVGIGSTFGADRRFTWRSDIDIVPMESATEAMLQTIRDDGVDL